MSQKTKSASPVIRMKKSGKERYQYLWFGPLRNSVNSLMPKTPVKKVGMATAITMAFMFFISTFRLLLMMLERASTSPERIWE